MPIHPVESEKELEMYVVQLLSHVHVVESKNVDSVYSVHITSVFLLSATAFDAKAKAGCTKSVYDCSLVDIDLMLFRHSHLAKLYFLEYIIIKTSNTFIRLK